MKDNNIKPHQSLLFLVGILCVLLVSTYFSPGGEFTLAEGVAIKLPQWSDVSGGEPIEYANISHLTEQVDFVSEEEDTTTYQVGEAAPMDQAALDSIARTSQLALTDSAAISAADTLGVDTEKMKAKTYPIEYREGGEADLSTFFAKLKRKNPDGKLRIMFYGDSQSEADRLTNEIRLTLQNLVGGEGIGLLPVFDDHPSYGKAKVTFKGNWKRYNRYAVKHRKVGHNRFGALLSFSRFTDLLEPDKYVAKAKTDGVAKDTLLGDSTLAKVADTLHKETTVALAASKNLSDSTLLANATTQTSDSLLVKEKEEKTIHEASIVIHKQKYPKRKHFFSNMKVMFGNNHKPFEIAFLDHDSLLFERTVSRPSDFDVIQMNFKEPRQEITIRFRGEESPDLYGISLESKQGVIVDNIPLRGSSGLEFARADFQHQAKMYNALDPDLIVLQFGVNVAPTKSPNYVWYRRAFSKQIQRLRAICPEIPIVVIGLNDVAHKNGLNFESYDHLEKIVEAQREAAFNNHCGFWNMYEAMGGKNSMPSWVNSTPALGAKDYTHFTYSGAKIIGQMFSNAFLNEMARSQSLDLTAEANKSNK